MSSLFMSPSFVCVSVTYILNRPYKLALLLALPSVCPEEDSNSAAKLLLLLILKSLSTEQLLLPPELQTPGTVLGPSCSSQVSAQHHLGGSDWHHPHLIDGKTESQECSSNFSREGQDPTQLGVPASQAQMAFTLGGNNNNNSEKRPREGNNKLLFIYRNDDPSGEKQWLAAQSPLAKSAQQLWQPCAGSTSSSSHRVRVGVIWGGFYKGTDAE